MDETLHDQFFQNKKCRYFPCHEGVDPKEFNCLFCYCPLYVLGKNCGGNCQYNEKGNKDCTACSFPHQKENYHKIIGRYIEIMYLVRKNDQENE